MRSTPSFKPYTVTLLICSTFLGLMTITSPMVSAANTQGGDKMTSSAPAAKLWSINRADAIKRFKAADTNGDCIISDSELQVYAISHIIDPTFEAIGYSIDSESQLQDVVKEAYHYMFNSMSMNGTKQVGPADFTVRNLDRWTCSPKVKVAPTSRSRSLIGRSEGASCQNMCTKNLYCCKGYCQTSSCPGNTACSAILGYVTVGLAALTGTCHGKSFA